VHRLPAGLELDPVPVRARRRRLPGLYFTGLPFLHSFASMLVGGAGRDAERVARHIAAGRMARPAPAGEARLEAQVS
jgi:hypothetical protein